MLGCAGSGKTMILMHRIRYMRYNYPDIKMDDIVVISPTDILGRESRVLSKLLQVDKVKQYTTASFYQEQSINLFAKSKIQYEEFVVHETAEYRMDYYDSEYLEELYSRVNNTVIVSNKANAFFSSEDKKIQRVTEAHVSILGERLFVQEMYGLYRDSVKELSKYGKLDIERIIRELDREIQERDHWEVIRSVLNLLIQQNCFTKPLNPKIEIKDDELSRYFVYTRMMVNTLDIDKYYRICSSLDNYPEGDLGMLQFFQLVMESPKEVDAFLKILNEWRTCPKKIAVRYLQRVESKIQRIYEYEDKLDILQQIEEISTLPSISRSEVKYDTALEKLVKLYQKTEELLEAFGYTPFSYFEAYEKINRKKQRLKEQKNQTTKYAYLFDAVLDVLDINYDINNPIVLPVDKAFAMLYLLERTIHEHEETKKYIYIDEFQDFSSAELKQIRKMFPNSVINVFGDVNQCITQKGISDVKMIPEKIISKKYEIHENYRNARQITEYVKRILGIEMMPVGLNGIQMVIDEFQKIDIHGDDRVAVIFSDGAEVTLDGLEEEKISKYSENLEIKRGHYNLFPVSQVKGLEFEKVIVFQKGMSNSEFYVACTRAISELYVIRSDEMDISKEIAPIERLTPQEKPCMYTEDIKSDMSCIADIDSVDIVPSLKEYQLITFYKKLKKVSGLKHVPSTTIEYVKNGNKILIPINYVQEENKAYVTERVYEKYASFFDEYFQKPVIRNMQPKLVVNSESVVEKEARPRKLECYIFQDTKTVKLLDEFEGLGDEKPYDQLVILSAMIISVNNHSERIDLVVERSRTNKYAGDITFTKFKQGFIGLLRTHIMKQLENKNISEAKQKGEMIRFDVPFLLRAQNSRNRTGYGWEWDWSDPYSPVVYEGTQYGETTNYIFSGVYIENK